MLVGQLPREIGLPPGFEEKQMHKINSRPSSWRAALVLSGAVMALPLTAFADMIVIASTVPSIEVNRMIQSGTQITVPEGGSVTLIDIHQNTLEITAPGGIVPGEPTSGTNQGESGSFVDMLKRFFAPEAAPKLGATRGAKLNPGTDTSKCAALAADISILLNNGCDERALGLWKSMQSQLKSSLFIGTSKGTGTVTYRYGETIQLQAQANFDAFLYCFHEASDGSTTRFIPFVGSTPRLNANAMGQLPGSLASDDFYISAGAPEGRDQIECFATEYDVAPQFPEILAGDPALGPNMLDKVTNEVFANIGTRVAQASLTIEVHN